MRAAVFAAMLLAAAARAAAATVWITGETLPAPPAAPCTHVEVAFTPGDDIAGLISARIAQARRSVQVQAYLFTDRRIARALLAALARGVGVEIIGDAGQFESGGLRWLPVLGRAGARIWLNAAVAASHNKIIIVDGESAGATVITGSYNLTQAAQARNAENVVLLSGNPQVTRRFVANFTFLREQATPWR